MHWRRIACFILGAWILGSVFAGYLALQDSAMVDRLLNAPHPELNKIIQTTGLDKVRAVLLYESAERTRNYLEIWERAQVVIGMVLTVVLFLQTRVSRLAVALCGAMLIFVLFAHFVLAPEIGYIGRHLDFVQGWSGNNKRIWVLRGVYGALELLKLGIGCALAGYLFVFKPRRAHTNTEPLTAVGQAT